MSMAFLSPDGIGRAFGHHGIITSLNLGRWPRLVWRRAFGPAYPQRAFGPQFRRVIDITARRVFRANGATPYQPGASPQDCRPQTTKGCALHAYLATVFCNVDCECLRVGGVTDHVHLAVRLSRTITVAQLIEELKTSSSKWLKAQSPALASFAWQRGYGAFSVGPSDLDILLHYIDTQEEHHRTRTFQDEYRGFFKKYGIAYDERYVWD